MILPRRRTPEPLGTVGEGIGTDEAFRRLRRHARDHKLEIRDVARQVVGGLVVLDCTD